MQSVTRFTVSSGNHDLTGPGADGEQSALWLSEARASGIPTDGDSLVVDGTLVTLCPFWDGPAGRTRVAEQLATDSGRGVPAAPVGVPLAPDRLGDIVDGPPRYGDADLAGSIRQYQPDLVLAGHVHESPFKPDGAWADRVGRTWVFNPGNQIGPVPTHIVLDLDVDRATWVSMLGTEEIDLAAEAVPARTVF